MKNFKILVFSFIISLGLTFSSNVSAQCSLCNANVQSGIKSSAKKTGLGLNDGIYLLLFMPYVLVGVVGTLWYVNRKRKTVA